MRVFLVFFLAAALSVASPLAQTRTAKTLDVYVIDVEGGNATLFVSPSGESVLIDVGEPSDGRDADRILAAVKDAGIEQIDHVIITHWHGDHFGGLPELAAKIPIRDFIDHGQSIEPRMDPAKVPEQFRKYLLTDAFEQQYRDLHTKAKHTIVKVGDRIPLGGLDWRIVSAGGEVLKTALPGAGRPNVSCAGFKPQDVDKTENAQSVGSFVTFGKFRIVHMGDLTWNKEFDLMCPSNRLGTADVFVVSHHGQPISNSPVLVHALQSRVAIMNNGLAKGGQPDAMRVLLSAPGLEDVWQLHFSFLGGQEYTAPGTFIANLEEATIPVEPRTPAQPGAPLGPPHNGPAHWIKVSAQTDGSFVVTNGRNGFSKRYAPVSGTN